MRSFTSLLSVIPTKISGQSTMTVYLTFSWRESPCLAFLRGLGLRFSEFFFQRLDLLACSFSKQLPLLLQITHTYIDWGCGRLIFGRLCAGLRMRLFVVFPLGFFHFSRLVDGSPFSVFSGQKVMVWICLGSSGMDALSSP